MSPLSPAKGQAVGKGWLEVGLVVLLLLSLIIPGILMVASDVGRARLGAEKYEYAWLLYFSPLMKLWYALLTVGFLLAIYNRAWFVVRLLRRPAAKRFAPAFIARTLGLALLFLLLYVPAAYAVFGQFKWFKTLKLLTGH